MYCEYFGLQEPPFSIAPNPRYLYMSEQHEEALSHLLYGIGADGSFILLTGEVGTGKTTLSRRLIEQLPDTTDFALILNPRLQPPEILQTICEELQITEGEVSSTSIKTLCGMIYRFLLQQHAAGRDTLLIIDEGQQMPLESLELLRMLTNLETNEAKLLKVVLLGQPELLAHLAREDMRQLSQRISARYHLGPLAESDLPQYIHHRLMTAGLARPIFPPATLHCLYRLSSGLPRVINQICDRALLGTYVQTGNEVNVETLKQAAREVLGEQQPKGEARRRWPLLIWLSLGLLIGLLGWGAGMGLSLYMHDRREEPEVMPDSAAAESGISSRDETLKVLRAQLFPWERGVDTAAPEPLDSVTLMASPAVLQEAEQDQPVLSSPQNTTAVAQGQVFSWQAPEDVNLAAVLAYIELFAIWQLQYDPRDEPVVCEFAARHQLGCLTQAGGLELLDRLDRPAVVTLTTEGQSYQALLVHLGAQQAELVVNGEPRRLSRARLQQLWGNSFTLLWRQPPGYRQPLWPGAQGGEVSWLDRQLARQRGDSQRRIGYKQRYDAELYLKVKQFQQQQGLEVDGVAGPMTLIRLNSLVDADPPRLKGQGA